MRTWVVLVLGLAAVLSGCCPSRVCLLSGGMAEFGFSEAQGAFVQDLQREVAGASVEDDRARLCCNGWTDRVADSCRELVFSRVEEYCRSEKDSVSCRAAQGDLCAARCREARLKEFHSLVPACSSMVLEDDQTKWRTTDGLKGCPFPE